VQPYGGPGSPERLQRIECPDSWRDGVVSLDNCSRPEPPQTAAEDMKPTTNSL